MERFKRIIEILSAVVSAVALTVAISAKIEASKAHRDSETEQALSKTYSVFSEINKMQIEHPEITHLLAREEDYCPTVSGVKQSVGLLSDQARNRLLLEETGMAYFVFSEFDRLVSALAFADEMNEKERSEFLAGTLEFYCKQLLRNPRLLWYWRDNHAKEYYGEDTVKYYMENVLKEDDGKPAALTFDPVGPFGPPTSSPSSLCK